MAGVDDKEQFFEELAAANRRRIMAIARAYAPARDRQDLYQEILLQVWKSLGAFQGRSAPSTWIYRVALNTAITFRRRNAKSETQTMPSEGSLSEDGYYHGFPGFRLASHQNKSPFTGDPPGAGRLPERY